MKIDSILVVVLTAGFLLPGFVWSGVLALLVPRRSGQAEIRFLEFFTLSCINLAIWFWLFVYFALTGYYSSAPLAASIWVLIALFVSPAVLGLVSGSLAQRDLPARFLRTLGFRTVHYLRSAWDWHFSRQKRTWAVVTLKNGSLVYGYFGYDSFAGSDPRDIYLEQLYRPSGDGFEPVEGSYGAFINADQIALIEFYKDSSETYDETD